MRKVPFSMRRRKWWSWKFLLKTFITLTFVISSAFLVQISLKGVLSHTSLRTRIRLMEMDKLESLIKFQEPAQSVRAGPLPPKPDDQQYQQQQQQQEHQQQQQQQQEQKQEKREQQEEKQQEQKQQEQKQEEREQQQRKQQLQQQKQQQQKLSHEDQQLQGKLPLKKSQERPDPKARMQRRLAQATTYCSARRKTSSSSSFSFRKASTTVCSLLSPRHHSRFCPIAKIASTFWTRFYQILRKTPPPFDALQSPYKVPLKGVDAFRCHARKTPNNTRQEEGFVQAVFVREPFSRMLSAYVDKLVSPNPIYWRKWGKPALTLAKVDPSAVRCGQSVTFKQFFRFVTQSLHRKDNHVMPMAAMCDPCRERYDVIGNMETFPEDLAYMMSLLNVSFERDVHLSRETKLDAIYDSIQGPFSWMREIKPCVSTPEMGRRIWRKLQIRGLISSRILYPLGDTDLTNMTVEQFNRIATDAHDKSTDKRELSRQKRVAFLQAYRSVSRRHLRDFVRVFRDDFEAFGYDMYPPSVFLESSGGQQSSLVTATDPFDVNKAWVVPETV